MKTEQLGQQLSLFFAETHRLEQTATVQTHPQLLEVCPNKTVVVGDALRISSDEDAQASPSTGESGASIDDCEWSAFLNEHGRVPMIGDAKKPWQYRGWLLYYRFMMEEHPGVGRRWDYWFRTMTAKSLLDVPIPTITFSACADKQVLKDLEGWI